jgi:hypothetical protein
MNLRPALLAAAALALGRWGAGENRDLLVIARGIQRGEELDSHFEVRWRHKVAKRVLANEVVAGRMSLREAAGYFRRLEEANPCFRAPPPGEERPLGENVLDAVWDLFAQQGRFAAAARWYAEVFTAHPHLLAGPPTGHRYYAAWAAVLAGCGHGQDPTDLDEESCAGFRNQALGWLRAELEVHRRLLEAHPERTRGWVAGSLTRWLRAPYFAAVRAPDALTRLPEDERRAWQELWEEVEALRQRADTP